MKKKLLTLAFAMIAMLGFSAMAQTDGTPGQNNKMRQPRSLQEMAFEGILLSVDQQARMDSLNNSLSEQRQAPRPEQNPDSSDARPDAQNDPLRDYIFSVKAILTPEQYGTFLENLLFMQMQQRPQGGPREGQAGQRGQRGQRQR